MHCLLDNRHGLVLHRHHCVVWGYMPGKTGESVITHFELVAEGIIPSTATLSRNCNIILVLANKATSSAQPGAPQYILLI